MVISKEYTFSEDNQSRNSVEEESRSALEGTSKTPVNPVSNKELRSRPPPLFVRPKPLTEDKIGCELTQRQLDWLKELPYSRVHTDNTTNPQKGIDVRTKNT